MGFNHEIYLGYYLKCKLHYSEEEVFGYRCPNCCSEISDKLGSFCPSCGSQGEKYIKDIIKKESIEPYDVVDSFHEALMFSFYLNSERSCHFYFANRGKGYIVGLSDEELYELEITDEVKKKLYNEFYDNHKEDIKLIYKFYGSDNVDVKFGLLKYYF